MDGRGVLLVLAVLGAAALGSTAACSGPDPGAITFSERPGAGAPDQSSGGVPPGEGADGGGGGDGGGDSIFGTSAFAWEDPGLNANEQNPDAHGGDVEGKDCRASGCHGDDGAKKWAFAGTVYAAAKDGPTVAKAEVRVIKADGTEFGRAYTDANGNFWFESDQDIPADSKVGVRKEGGAAPMKMATMLQPGDGGCSANRANCHGTASQGHVYVP